MRSSQLLLTTLKETPHDADTISQQLMLRAAMVRKLASGLYTWLPLGLRVLRKVEAIVRCEMNRAAAQEMLMPSIQPAELWQETGRWDQYGPLLLKMTDRQQRLFCYGPTHEEIVTDVLRGELTSYKQLPVCLYQIQTKFRDEIRPRFGVMRAREFIMKDAYSFDIDESAMAKSYHTMFQAYHAIFTRLGLSFRAVQADSGEIGGSTSHEFQVLADAGEDVIFYSDQGSYAANRELATCACPSLQASHNPPLQKIATPNQRSIEQVSSFLKIDAQHTVKCVLVKGQVEPVIALILRGDHTLNDVKATKCTAVAKPLVMAEAEDIRRLIGAEPGSIGPIGLNVPFYIDRDAMALADFVCGANETDFHYTGVNWDRDVFKNNEQGNRLQHPRVLDLRNVEIGDRSPEDDGHLTAARGIEVGHVFQLGRKYTSSMKLSVLDEQGNAITPFMGCYGIGVTRIVAAAIEQHHDAKGIIWPMAMAPFHIALVGLNRQKSEAVAQATEALYHRLTHLGLEVLWDDRTERPGVIFADLDLIGIPHRLVISDKTLVEHQVEYKNRCSGELQMIALTDIEAFCQSWLKD